MGLGALGMQVATSLVALGFPVRGWSRSVRQVPGVRCFAGPEGLRAFAGGLQALVNLLPLTAATENILNQDLFAHLAPGATLINVARGGPHVERALIAALDSGQLESAMLDVFRVEPLPAAHPFWRDQRIEITPHVAAETPLFASIRQIAAKIRALENGEAVAGVVDLQRGY
jgi:glyoxylate/hydroxypyruvate reductase A